MNCNAHELAAQEAATTTVPQGLRLADCLAPTAQDTDSPESEIVDRNSVIDYADAGLCMIPLRLDGSKAPLLPIGHPYLYERPSNEQILEWQRESCGWGMVMGRVSGGAECLDFDGEAEKIYPAWRKLVPKEIRKKLTRVQTPSGGYHVIYRCQEHIGSKKIARAEDGATLIESRGEGSYIVSTLSLPEVHELCKPYVEMSKKLPILQLITPEERKCLWQAAATFNQGESAQDKLIAQYVVQLKQRRKRSVNPSDNEDVKVFRASRYLEKKPPAISGQGGHNRTYAAACRIMHGFDLTHEQTLDLLVEKYNPRCVPPWTLAELVHKVDDADKIIGPRGHLLGE